MGSTETPGGGPTPARPPRKRSHPAPAASAQAAPSASARSAQPNAVPPSTKSRSAAAENRDGDRAADPGGGSAFVDGLAGGVIPSGAVDVDRPDSDGLPAPAGETGWKRSLAGGIAFLRRRMTGDYDVDDFGYDPDFTDNVLMPPLRLLYEKWFRIDTLGIHNVPDTGGALLVANHSGTIAVDAVMTAVALRDHHPQQRPLRMLGADLVFDTPFLGPISRKAGNTLACNPDAERLLSSGEVVAVYPGGFQGRRQALFAAVQAAAVRPGRVRHRRTEDRSADHPGVDRRRRGDLPADRQHQAAGPCAGLPLFPGDADVPAARAAGRDTAAEQVADRVR